MTGSRNWFLTRWYRHWKRDPASGRGQAKHRKPITTSITIDDPYQLPEGGWICLVWRSLKVFPCTGPSRPVVIAIANKMACALALHISEEAVLRDVACHIVKSEAQMKSLKQLDMFESAPRSLTAAAYRDEENLGHRDAACGLPLQNYYSNRIFGERLAAYELGYRKGLRAGGHFR